MSVGNPRAPRPLALGAGPAEAEPDGPGSLWLVDAAQEGSAALGLAAGYLDAHERRRAAAFRREEDRRCYVTAHVALRVLLGARTGTGAGGVRFEREPCASCGGPHGQFVAPDAGLHFSLSHSGDLTLLAFGPAALGVDVEALPSRAAVRELGGQLHPREHAELLALAEEERPAAFARTWVRKEAYLKGLGLGLSRDVSLDYVGTGPGGASALPGWSVADVAVPSGFAGAVAVPDAEGR
uniref:4'-phosphopantetheinyl transferase superfamily protein n=1 Tax=Streptomyces sp. NBC_01393 TaxID=2903851 RepID=A0AAU3HYQ9_9ACTN